MNNDSGLPFIAIDPYWNQFKPVPFQIYYFLMTIYVFIGVVGLIGNAIVLGLYFRYSLTITD